MVESFPRCTQKYSSFGTCFLIPHWWNCASCLFMLEHFFRPFLKTSHGRSAHTFGSSHRFLEVPHKGVLNRLFFYIFLQLPEVPLLLPGGRGVGFGGPKGPSRWPKVSSPPQELEVGTHRAPYLLVLKYFSWNYNTHFWTLLLLYSCFRNNCLGHFYVLKIPRKKFF